MEWLPYLDEDEIKDLIRRMVARPSHSGITRQETETAREIQAFFRHCGIPCELEPVSDGRCNVTAVLPGSGSGKSLLLTGHTDTVPPYGMAEPYTIRESGGRLYGRGTVDMKGPLACMMAAMAAVRRSRSRLSGDLVFAGVADEETGSRGTIKLIEEGRQFEGAIVGEPTGMALCTAHRGLTWLEFLFQGKTVHGGSQEEGINAIDMALDFILCAREQLLPRIKAEYHPDIGTSTVNWAVIRGGTQPSTVPGQCILRIDRRWVPGVAYSEVIIQFEELLAHCRQSLPSFACEMKVMPECRLKEGYVLEAMATPRSHSLVQDIAEASTEVTGQPPELSFFPAWSDGGLLASSGIPTVVMGPGGLSSAHSSDEHIEIASLVPAAATYAETAARYCR